MRKKNNTSYWLYDGRYNTDPDRAIVYCVAETLTEAKRDKREDFPDAVIVKTISKHTGGNSYEVIKQERI